MTLHEAWDILEAAGAIARAHGWECYPTVRLRCLVIELQRGFERRIVVLTEDQLEACADTAAVRALVEREVAVKLASKAASA